MTVATSSSQPLTAGSFSLLYVGPQSLRVYLLVAQGSTTARVLSRTLSVAANDFFRVAGTLYQVHYYTTTHHCTLLALAPFVLFCFVLPL